MSDTAVLHNAIAWAHNQLRGGRRNAITYSVGYVVIIGGLIMLAVRADPNDVRGILYGWMIALLALQIGILVLFGGVAVRGAVRRDATTGMLASHRLMPISGTQAVTGYVLGACPQPLAVGLSNLLLGILIAGPAQMSVPDWIAANGLLFLFAACTWVIVACASLISPKSAGAALVALVLFTVSGGVVATVVPAVTVVCSPIVGSTIFGIVMKGAAWSPMLHLSIMAQLAMTALFFVAAARKYQRDDVVSITPLLGVLIVAVYVTISVLGIRNWSLLQPTVWRFTGDVAILQAIGSMVAGLLLGFLPVGSAAWLQEDYRRRRILNDPALPRRPISSVILALGCALMISAIPPLVLAHAQINTIRVCATAVCLIAALVPASYLLRLIYRKRAAVSTILALWIGLTWILPWLISFGVLMAYGMEETIALPQAWDKSEYIAGFSPIGSLISIWTSHDRPYLPGIVFQSFVALAMAVVHRRQRLSADDLSVPVG